jgi:hypothetical protein
MNCRKSIKTISYGVLEPELMHNFAKFHGKTPLIWGITGLDFVTYL